MKVSLIAGMAANRTIWKDNTLPWNYPEDLKYFRDTTVGHTIIMGKNTYESIGRPLPNRRNIVLSRSMEETDDIEVFDDMNYLLECLNHQFLENDEVFVIWWAKIYELFLPICDKIYLTEIKKEYEGDTFFPEFESDFKEVSRTKHPDLDFVVYERI